MSAPDPQPHRYRKGVGALVFNSKGEVLVARRIGMMSAWQLPQGGVHRGEDAWTAVKRELREEIGTDRLEVIAEYPGWLRYELPEGIRGKVWKGKYCGQEQRWFAFRFTGDDSDIDLAAHPNPEFDAWRWVEIRQLPALAVAFKRHLYEQLADHFEAVAQTDGTSRL